jgi:membrane protein YqaA with SNARE-associated domain
MGQLYEAAARGPQPPFASRTIEHSGRALKNLIAKWTHHLMVILGPLGVWGVIGFAAIDAALLGMPIDAIVCGYAYANPTHLLLYTFGAATGSAMGSLVVYAIGYKGGEVMLRKRMGDARYHRITSSFEKREFPVLFIVSMLPPPTPFKLFVLSAGMAEMRTSRFVLAIFLGRFLRFTIESILVIRYGPHIIVLLAETFRHHLNYVIAAVVAVALAGWWTWRIRKARMGRRPTPNTIS